MNNVNYCERSKEGTKRILDLREDISDFLFHFTKGANAFEDLCEILSSGKLIDIKKRGFICFTEAPLRMLQPMLDYFSTRYPEKPMYAPYGIGINKYSFFDIGGRPVIYGKEEERELLDDSIKWRFEKMNDPILNYSWLREWRINKSELPFSRNGIMVITKMEEEQALLCHKLIDNTPAWYTEKDGAFFDIERDYFGVSMEEISRFNSKHDLLKQLLTQNDEM